MITPHNMLDTEWHDVKCALDVHTFSVLFKLKDFAGDQAIVSPSVLCCLPWSHVGLIACFRVKMFFSKH